LGIKKIILRIDTTFDIRILPEFDRPTPHATRDAKEKKYYDKFNVLIYKNLSKPAIIKFFFVLLITAAPLARSKHAAQWPEADR